MPISLTIPVEEPDVILNAGMYGAGAVIRLQTAATEAGAYADVSGTGSTPTIAVVSGQRSYPGYDPNGSSTSWYRTRFENVGATRLSDWSPAFQAAPEGSGLICSLWDVKQALGKTGLTDTADDEQLLEAIRRVTDDIIEYTGRQFVRQPASGTATWTEDVGVGGGLLLTGSRTLWFPRGIATLTTLEVATATQPESGGTYTTVTAAEVFLRPTATVRGDWPATRIDISDLSASYFSRGYNTVRLTGARGWDTVPYRIQAVAERAVVAAFLSKGSGAGGVAAIGPGGGTTILRHISPADRAVLDEYRVIGI